MLQALGACQLMAHAQAPGTGALAGGINQHELAPPCPPTPPPACTAGFQQLQCQLAAALGRCPQRRASTAQLGCGNFSRAGPCCLPSRIHGVHDTVLQHLSAAKGPRCPSCGRAAARADVVLPFVLPCIMHGQQAAGLGRASLRAAAQCRTRQPDINPVQGGHRLSSNSMR